MVHAPTVAMVKRPTHLQDTTAPRDKPVKTSHVHHCSVNGSFLSSFENPTKKKVVRAVKNTRGESSRIWRDCVTSPFSNVRNIDPSSAVVARQSRARKVRYASGTVATPNVAGTIRIATYGTFSKALVNAGSMPERNGLLVHSLSNILEVKIAIETKYEGCGGDKQFCKRRVHVDEVSCFDVARCKFTKMDFVKTGQCSRSQMS